MTESYKRLYKILRDTEFGCVPAGFHETEEVYELVREEYPDLCDDSIPCRDVCGTDSDQSEWKHRIRTVQQDLVRYDTRLQNLSKGWYYGPFDTDVVSVPDAPEFEVGQAYNRWDLHDEFGGQRYSGIATPADRALIFIFTGESGEDYGYEDRFRDDGTFLYTGEGAEGDMKMEGGNRAIREHRDHNEALHLFEDTNDPWIVTYVGQYEYVDHDWLTLEDENGDDREGLRFRLEPVGGTEIDVGEGTVGTIPENKLFEKAKQSAPTGDINGSRSTTTTTRTYTRAEVVKEFALRSADGVCQGCGRDAPFKDRRGQPFLEVHHLHRRSDGGADDPENVIALCPNCHRRVHHGRDSEEFNQELIRKAEERNATFS
jgi:5-methylcytosine-specific restriction protein A